MKKVKLFFFLTVACLAMSLFTSCNDQNTPVTPPAQDLTPVAAGMKFTATFDTLTIQMCDISFDYYDEKGQKKNEVVNTTVWKKLIKSDALPATFGFHWNLAVKADLDTTKFEHFVVDYGFTYESVALNASDAAVSQPKGAAFGNTMNMAMRKRNTVVETIMNSNPVNFVHKYDAKGVVTVEDWK
jgi:hypothetical protein